jgi:uncharacterized protein YcbX
VSTPTVAHLLLHPIKSLDRVSVSEARLLSSGAFAHDREFALFDHTGNYVNGKSSPRVHLIRVDYDLANFTVTVGLRGQNDTQTFHLFEEQTRLEAWFSDFFGFSVIMKRNTTTGFPDDLVSPGPTLISVATLDEVSSWFPELNRQQVSRRFRANIEITNAPAFWEDRLFGAPGETAEFAIGQVTLLGVNPCQRCVVPSRHPETGDLTHGFQKTFAEKRKATLPTWVNTARFNHFYRLSINTRLPSSEAGKIIHVGDAIHSGRTCG